MRIVQIMFLALSPLLMMLLAAVGQYGYAFGVMIGWMVSIGFFVGILITKDI